MNWTRSIAIRSARERGRAWGFTDSDIQSDVVDNIRGTTMVDQTIRAHELLLGDRIHVVNDEVDVYLTITRLQFDLPEMKHTRREVIAWAGDVQLVFDWNRELTLVSRRTR